MTGEYRLTLEAWKALKEPFKPSFIQWRPVRFNHERTRALVVPFYDARLVVVRLDDVVGPANWMVNLESLEGGGLKTTISIRVDDGVQGRWVSKTDVGYIDRDTDHQTGEIVEAATKIKGDASDGLKRAGMLWGIGRVYWMIPRHIKDEYWVDWDPQKKKMEGPPPALPSWALPYGEAPTKPPVDPDKPVEGDTGAQDSEEKGKEPPKPEEPAELAKRPYDVETLRERLAALIEHFETTGETVSKSKRGTFIGMLRLAFVQRKFDKPDGPRKQVLMELFGVDSGTKLTDAMVLAGLKWADPHKDPETNKVVPIKEFVQEVIDVYMIGGANE